MKRFLAFALALSAAGCGTLPGTPAIQTLEEREWRAVATTNDRDRLRDWRSSFIAARTEAIEAGYGDEVAALGATGAVDAAQPLGTVPNGNYRCRTIKLGTQGGGTLAFIAYDSFQCRIRTEEDLQGFAKLTGSQRQVGLLFPDDAFRHVFLGTLVLGNEDRAMRYGADPQRDVVGALQRVGPDRYRLLIPSPRFESKLDIIELIPET